MPPYPTDGEVMRDSCQIMAVLLLVLPWAASCGGSDTRDDQSAGGASLIEVEVTDKSEIEKFDLNGDGKPDVWKTFTRLGDEETPDEERERILARAELDVNFDGNVDMKQFYNSDGVMLREEMDLDFDGNFDAVDYYRDGKIVKREMALNFEKRTSMWKYFEDGKLIRKERDTTSDGKPDTFEYYEKGRLARVGFDRNGDQKPDYYEQPPEAE